MPERQPESEFQADSIDSPRELQWLLPDEIVRMLEGVADILGLKLAGDYGKPLPNRHYREVIGWLVRPLFIENPPERMQEVFDAFSQQDKAYFVHLLRTALIEVREKRSLLPNIPLGVPSDTFGTWSNILARSWLPLPQNMRYKLR